MEHLLELLRRAERLFESAGGGTDQLAHALQCAHELRAAAPEDVELQVAGLFHDVGHVLDPTDDASHGRLGADAVRPVFGDRVARLVELHVPAKRYLVAVESGYALSSGSTRSLQQQGGPMTADEVAAFAALSECDDAVLLRRADEAAKVPGREVPDLDAWIPVLHQVAT